MSVFVFWLIAALFVVAAVALVLISLLRKRQSQASGGHNSANIAIYRDQMRELENDQRNGLLGVGQFEVAKLEIEARLALDASHTSATARPAAASTRWLGVSLAGVIPVVAFGVYFLIGNPDAIITPAMAQAELAADASQTMEDLLKKVEDRVHEDPDDIANHILLGKTYGLLGRWADAEQAYSVAYDLAPDNATVLANYAEAIAKASDLQLKGRPLELLREALEINPDETKALELAGVRAYQNKEFALAAYYWRRLTKLLSPTDPYAKDIAEYMKDAKRQAMAASFGAPIDDLADQKEAAVTEKTLAGMIEISPALQAKLTGSETVFFFARAASGSDEPLVAMSTQVEKLPLVFELDNALTGNALSEHENVTLIAHISMSGQQQVQTGDFEGQLQMVKVGSQNLKLVIDTVHK